MKDGCGISDEEIFVDENVLLHTPRSYRSSDVFLVAVDAQKPSRVYWPIIDLIELHFVQSSVSFREYFSLFKFS